MSEDGICGVKMEWGHVTEPSGEKSHSPSFGPVRYCNEGRSRDWDHLVFLYFFFFCCFCTLTGSFPRFSIYIQCTCICCHGDILFLTLHFVRSVFVQCKIILLMLVNHGTFSEIPPRILPYCFSLSELPGQLPFIFPDTQTPAATTIYLFSPAPPPF